MKRSTKIRIRRRRVSVPFSAQPRCRCRPRPSLTVPGSSAVTASRSGRAGASSASGGGPCARRRRAVRPAGQPTPDGPVRAARVAIGSYPLPCTNAATTFSRTTRPGTPRRWQPSRDRDETPAPHRRGAHRGGRRTRTRPTPASMMAQHARDASMIMDCGKLMIKDCVPASWYDTLRRSLLPRALRCRTA
jgi:hypothetical protein